MILAHIRAGKRAILSIGLLTKFASAKACRGCGTDLEQLDIYSSGNWGYFGQKSDEYCNDCQTLYDAGWRLYDDLAGRPSGGLPQMTRPGKFPWYEDKLLYKAANPTLPDDVLYAETSPAVLTSSSSESLDLPQIPKVMVGEIHEDSSGPSCLYCSQGIQTPEGTPTPDYCNDFCRVMYESGNKQCQKPRCTNPVIRAAPGTGSVYCGGCQHSEKLLPEPSDSGCEECGFSVESGTYCETCGTLCPHKTRRRLGESCTHCKCGGNKTAHRLLREMARMQRI